MSSPEGLQLLCGQGAKYSRDMSMEEAVDKAVLECIEADYLKDVLSEERAAVMLEMLTRFDEKSYEEGLREEGREEERANTEKERLRAEAAEKRAEAAEKKLAEHGLL